MAARAVAVTAALCLAALTFGPLAVVLVWAEGFSTLRAGDLQAVRFTLWQAILSGLFSCVLAVPVARALARRRFAGRGVLVTLLGAPFILPVIVAVMGLIAVFGRAGLLNDALAALGLARIDIYGLHGVVLAHVFFNLPLAVRILLQAWLAVPAERFRLAQSLGLGPWAMFALVEWPLIRRVLPGAFAVIFVICLTSFAVALTLGGGPRATTVELAIYEAFRFDFDLARAAKLALVQFAMGAGGAFLAFKLTLPHDSGQGLDRAQQRWDGNGLHLGADVLAISLATAFLIVPLGMIFWTGVPRVATLPDAVWWAALRSVLVALGSTVATLMLALPIAALAVKRKSRLVEGVGYLTIAASPLVIGTGLFIVVFPFMRPSDLALPITALVNAAMSLPFVLRVLVPALAAVERDYGRLADGLGLAGWARLRLLWGPRLRRPLGFALGLSAALSMGDLGVIAMFADPEIATLPLQLFRLKGAYRMDDAAGAAVLLLMLSLLLFWIFDRGGRVNADR